MSGWALFLAYLLVRMRRQIASVFGHPRAGQAALFVSTAFLLCLAHHHDRPDPIFPPGGRVEMIRPLLESLNRFPIPLPPDPHILLLDDPFPADEWGASMILQLHYRQPELEVLRAKVPSQLAVAGDRMNVILDWREGRLIRSK